MKYLYYAILAIVCYFLGNITWARAVAKTKHDDITKHGSGNPGTLNAWRSYGFWSGIVTFVLDMVTLICFVVMIVSMLFIKYASICTLGYVLVLSIVELCLVNPANWVNYILIAGILLLVYYAHRGNVKRLFTGKENKTELLAMLKKIGKRKAEQLSEPQQAPATQEIEPADKTTEQPIADANTATKPQPTADTVDGEQK